jgi:Fic family protein
MRWNHGMRAHLPHSPRLAESKPLAARNLSGQQMFLESEVKAALQSRKSILTPGFVRELNRHAVAFISETAGEYRRGRIAITNTRHTPPAAAKVPARVRQCMGTLMRKWERKPPMHLAAYALWRLGWIHPFMEGNGRTARAVCQAIICLKYGAWMHESLLMPKKSVHRLRARYYAALRAADESFARDKEPDLALLEAYLKTLLFKGVSRALMGK